MLERRRGWRETEQELVLGALMWGRGRVRILFQRYKGYLSRKC